MLSLIHKIEELEKDEIRKALQESRWIKIRAAQRLGITERMIGYRIKKYGIRKEEMKSQKLRSQNPTGGTENLEHKTQN